MVLNAKKEMGKHEMGEENARVQPERMTTEYRPKGGGGVKSEGKVLQVEGRARGQVLRHKHKRCAGGKPRSQNGRGGKRAEGEAGCRQLLRSLINLVGAWFLPE